MAFHVCDTCRGELPDRIFDAVVHLAALAGVRPSMDLPMEYEITDVIGTIRLLEYCRRMGVPHVVFASSSSVYGRGTPLPAEESTPANPCSPYALTKLHDEQWGRLYSNQHGLCFLTLRFFSVWGPGQRPDLALEAFRRRIEAGQSVIIKGDGTQRRDLTHVARAIELALGWQGTGAVVLNVGTGRNHSVLDMLAAARKTTTPLVEHQARHPANEPETLALITAVGARLGWQPRIIFPDGPDS